MVLDNITIHHAVLKNLLKPSKKPITLFLELYILLEPNFGAISNPYFNSAAYQVKCRKLSDFFLRELLSLRGAAISQPFIDKAVQKINSLDDTNLACLAMFAALGDYLATAQMGTLKRLPPQKIGGYILTPKPPNPIHQSLAAPMRENYGTGIKNLSDIFDNITITRETRCNIHVIRNKLLERTSRYLEKALERGIKIAVTPFTQTLELESEPIAGNWPEGNPSPFGLKKIANFDATRDWLEKQILTPCLENEVTILVLPELAVDNDLLGFIKKWLNNKNRKAMEKRKPGLLMTVAGSFHVEKQKKRFNMSRILDHNGEELWAQDKMKRFAFDKKDIESLPFLKGLCTSPAGGHEAIEETNTLCMADTPLGRICVSLCIDFFHRDHIDTYIASGCNVFLVPAMTPGTIRFKEMSSMMARNNLAATFFSNNGAITGKKATDINEKNASFYLLPGRREEHVYALDQHRQLLIWHLKDN